MRTSHNAFPPVLHACYPVAALRVQPEIDVVREDGAVQPVGQRWQVTFVRFALPVDHVVGPHGAQVGPP